MHLCPWLWLPCVDTKSIRGEKRFSAVFNFTLEPEYSKWSKSYNIQNHFNCTTWTLQCELFGGSASCPQCCISASIPSTHKCNPKHVLWLKLFTFLPLVFYNFGSNCVTILALSVLQFWLWMCYNFGSDCVTILALDVLQPLNSMHLVDGQGVLALAVVRTRAWKERIYISLQQMFRFELLTWK